MPRVILLIDGEDAQQAVYELISASEYDKLKIAIWVADDPTEVVIKHSSLLYADGLDKESNEND